MEYLRSRQSAVIRSVRELSADAQKRDETGLFLCDGKKLLTEAMRSDAEIVQVLWRECRDETGPEFPQEYLLSEELFEYASPMKHSPGPIFTVRMKKELRNERPNRVLILEEVQDPGNVGTVLRAADAFGIDAVILLDGCADLYAPKTVRATMGAIFRQCVFRLDRETALARCRDWDLPIYAAALSPRAQDLRELDLNRAAVAVGSEGHGLSTQLLAACDGELIIPMCGAAESLNAAMASTVIMWEMQR